MKIEIDHLRRANIDSVIEGLDNCLGYKYHQAFEEACDTTKDTDTELHDIYTLMSGITHMRFDPSDRQAPFKARYVLDDCRGLIPDDLGDETLVILSQFSGEILNSQLRSRILDLCWLRLRKPEVAYQAITAYLEAANKVFDPENWNACADFLERALRLAAAFARREASHIESVVKHIEGVIDKLAGKDPLFLSLSLMETLSAYSDDRSADYYSLSVQIAQSAVKKSKWHKAEKAWKIAEIWAGILKDNDKLIFSRKEIAETYATQAEACAPDMTASHWMQKAVEAYKKIPNSRARRDDLYEKLREYQKATVKNMSKFEGPTTDITELVNIAREAVRGCSFDDALFKLCFTLAKPLDFTKLKKQAIADSKRYVMGQLFSSVHYDRDGLVVATVPALSGLGNSDNDKALWASMLNSAQISHGFSVQASIEPARREILLEHDVREPLLYSLLENNPFVPQGREPIFARGLSFGFNGDFISATHILVPQLENSLRHVLQQKGVETTTLNTHGLQEHIRLSAILDHDVFEQVFGKNISLELQGLLIDRKYANLRNEVSHGLMSSNQFYSVAPVYLWWLTTRLCLMPYFSDWNSKPEDDDSQS